MNTYFRILKAIIRENKKQTAFCCMAGVLMPKYAREAVSLY